MAGPIPTPPPIQISAEEGAPTSYALSFSTDNITFAPATTVNTGFTNTTGVKSDTELVAATARYVRFQFDDATITGGNKYGLSDIKIEGTAVPEPSSTALAGLALSLRRRR